MLHDGLPNLSWGLASRPKDPGGWLSWTLPTQAFEAWFQKPIFAEAEVLLDA